MSAEATGLDLPIQTGEEAIGPLSDFSLGERGAPAGAEAAAPTTVSPPGGSSRRGGSDGGRRPMPAGDLPLFKDRVPDDDAPLVTPPAVPRAPLAVRRSTPAVPRAPRDVTGEPELDLELPGTDAGAAAPEPPARRTPSSSPAADHPTADLGPRLAAGVIDAVIVCGVDLAVLYFTLKICGFARRELLLLPIVPLVAFLALLNGGYFVAFIAAGGQTIGKMAAGIKVVPAEDAGAWTDRVPLGTAFLRAAACLVSLAPAGAGLLPALLTADRRAVHDRLAHTRVVKA